MLERPTIDFMRPTVPAKPSPCAEDGEGMLLHRRHFLDGAVRWVVSAALAASFSACSKQPAAARGTPVPPGATVLALGDSITFGTGAPPEAAYPAVLAGLTGWAVVNAGVPGHTSAQALQRLPALLAEHRPALVIVSIGGNDLLRRGDEGALRDNRRRTLAAVRGAGAQALLVAVPQPTLAAHLTGSLDDHPLYADIATEAGVPLHPQGWSTVLADKRLKSDAIHGNAAGYEAFARGLLGTLQAAGLLSR
jgi:lysophospholipase L1-like esterase